VTGRVADTLHAAALDEDARTKVRDGRLERELRHAGLGVDLGAGDSTVRAPDVATRKKVAKAAAGKQRRAPASGQPSDLAANERERAAHERDLARRVERERATAHKAARADELAARRAADRAARALKAEQERRERAWQVLSEVEAALATAQAQAETSAEAHRRAKQKLETGGDPDTGPV
jgi:hypothetical protein